MASEPPQLGHFNIIWTMDTFYIYLSAGLFDTQALIDGIRFLLPRSSPRDAPLIGQAKGPDQRH